MDGDEGRLNARAETTESCRMGALSAQIVCDRRTARSPHFVATFTKFHCRIATLIGQRARLPALTLAIAERGASPKRKRTESNKDERHGPI
jgi:hypothetical protein